MSALSDVVTVHLMMADYAAADPAGKLNMIGGGVAVLGRLAAAPVTSPFFLIASLSVPPDHYGDESYVEIRLEDTSGNVVVLPGATPDLPSTPLVIRQTAKFNGPTPPPQLRFPDRYLQGYLRARVQMVVGFPGGLPLPTGGGYVWRVSIGAESRSEWSLEFVVAEQAPPT